MKPEKRYPVMSVSPSGRVNIVLAGCGGTGSFLALHLARLAYHVRERHGQPVRIVFVDPDQVEAKNIGRQNFAPVEVGEPKAWTLMRRCNAAFGLDIEALVQPYVTAPVADDHRALNIVIGAVDNAAGRRAIDETANRQWWWLDCGNHEHAGQVLLGNRHDLTAPELALNFCTGLPTPGVQHPELLIDAPEATEAESCAELTLRDAQSLMVNQAVATFAAQYVYRLVVTRDLDVSATYFDLASGSARSLGIISPEITAEAE